jgi:tetratricopeptide (TPR) repeat protein
VFTFLTNQLLRSGANARRVFRTKVRRKKSSDLMTSSLTKARSLKESFVAHPRRRDLLVCLGLALITIMTLGGCLRNKFVNYDDDLYVQNINVQGGLFFENIVWAFTTTTSNHWHPLTWLSLQWDAELFGEQPAGYHLSNLLLHTANTLLLFVVLRSMTGEVGRGALVAALFSIHPLHVESVAWVTERKDVLSTFFGLITLLVYVRFTRTYRAWIYLVMSACFILSLLAKPMLVTLPAVMLLFDYWPLRRLARFQPRQNDRHGEVHQQPCVSVRRALVEKIPLLMIALASALASLHAREQGGGLKSGVYLSLLERCKCAVLATVDYLKDTVWPAELAPYYPLPREHFPDTQALVAALVLLAITCGALAVARKLPYITVGWLFYLGTLVPVSGLVQLGSYARADRYTYVPLIGILILLVWGVADLFERRRVTARWTGPLAVLLLLACLFRSWQQVEFWHDSVALWQHALCVTGDNYFARIKLGEAFQNECHLPQAREQFRAAVRLRPDVSITHLYLGRSFLSEGAIEDALLCFRQAEAIDPHSRRVQAAFLQVESLQRQSQNQLGRQRKE